MTYTLTFYQYYEQHGKTFQTLKELSKFAIELENAELGYCTTYTDTKTKKQISEKVFRNWLDKERHEYEKEKYQKYPCFSCDGKNCETCKKKQPKIKQKGRVKKNDK